MASRTAVSASMFAAASLILAASATAGPEDDAKAPAEAEAPETLRIGDEAMDLSPEILWMRNMLVPEFKEDTVYVVYLWSPDSPNSMGSFPQLHGLDQKLREEGVVTISIALDLVPGGFEPHDVVRSRAEFMAHTVAEDRGTFIKDHWFMPTGFKSVPVVFVIDKEGTIAYIDDKLNQVEKVARAVANDQWSIEAAAGEFNRVRELEARLEPMIDGAMKAANQGNWAEVINVAEQLLEEDKQHYYKMAMTKFMLLLTKLNKPGDAYKWGYAIVDDHIKNDSAMLIAMAETVNFSPGIPYRDYNLARQAAQRADELTGGQLGQVKNALAASWMGLGETGKAIEIQMEAVEHAPTAEIKQQYQTTLDRYLNAPSGG